MAQSSFSGGRGVEEALNKIARKIGESRTLNVGFLKGATYPDGTPVALVAAMQEFGTPNAQFPIPPRPFFRNMIAKEKGGWPALIENALKSTDYDIDQTLDMVGQVIKGQLQQSIIDTLDPPLSEVTLMLRSMKANDPNLRITRRTVYEAIARVKSGNKSGVSGTGAKPLVQTGHLLNSVDYEIKGN